MELEKKPLIKQFIPFVIPSVAAQWVFALYTMIDGMFVANGVSEIALASVNIAMPFVNFTFALALIMAVGTSTVVSIFMGQQKQDEANRVYTQNFVVVILVSVFHGLIAHFGQEPIAKFLGANDATLEYVKTYVSTVGYFAVFFMLGYYFEILVKADGRPKMATIVIILGAVSNCILDYVFVFVIEWGVFGAALATGLSQLVVTVIFLVYFLSSKAKLRLVKFRLNIAQVWRTIKLGIPSGITDFSSGIMIFMFNHAILTNLGNEELVSYTIVAYVNTIIIMSMTGIAQGAQPLVSYYHGRGMRDHCTKLLRYGLITAIGLTLAIGIPAWLGAPWIVSLFISEELMELRAYSVAAFRIFSISFLVAGFNIVVSGYFTSVEYEKPAMVISLGRGFALIAFSLWILVKIFGGEGIWWASVLSELICGVITLLFLKRYKRQRLTG